MMMTTRKQVMDSYKAAMDEQQRASNGQFGTGSGTSAPHPNSKAGKALAKTRREAGRQQALKEQIISGQNVGSSMHKALEYGQVERKSQPYQQERTAEVYARTRKLRGVEDACKGIKGILDALSK
jgi:hypothetical protein